MGRCPGGGRGRIGRDSQPCRERPRVTVHTACLSSAPARVKSQVCPAETTYKTETICENISGISKVIH